MRVWYKNIGDNKPTMVTYGDEMRPGEFFFEADPIQPRFAPLLKIAWKGESPSAKYPAAPEIDAWKKKIKAKRAAAQNRLHPWGRAIVALRHETKGTATAADLEILDDLQKKM